ncbi:MAG: putative secondary metabolism biosynthetic enzyme [Chrysothrix sp. TS-e1954]|nr:MAG: putative secondary metabolism biosynthetic enzyme [Chrysothrix sp. TS-e1954]
MSQHGNANFTSKLLPDLSRGKDLDQALDAPAEIAQTSLHASADSIAYLHHTSGTSSGLPKPIPQSHHAAIGVLPDLSDQQRKATFTTTALYHGGIADLFRAWSGGSPIWIYADKDEVENRKYPITANNVQQCLLNIDNLSGIATIDYFSCVPYVLQMMADDPSGLLRLRSMDLVGVGGAALPTMLGDFMVDQGVNLVSRFGSAECGFFMSSYRDFAKDKEWQFLRPGSGADMMNFERHEDDRYELVALPTWPHLAKKNRSDGSYATSDLFVKHSSIAGAWKYDSRADSQLTLVTGKKFDPAPLESSIASSTLLEDALVFGNGRMFPGSLVFRNKSARDMSDAALIAQLAPEVARLNEQSQSHARISRNMLIPIPHGDNKLQKSSKGTILRNKAEVTYLEHISAAYDRFAVLELDVTSDKQMTVVLQNLVESILGVKPDPDADLFSCGVDSVASMQIRQVIIGGLPRDSPKLPLTIVEDCGTTRKLAEHLVRQVRKEEGTDESTNELDTMRDLVEKYSIIDEQKPALHNGNAFSQPSMGDGVQETIVVTGVTGALGAYILDVYRKSSSTTRVICLVRGADKHAARERVHKSLVSRKLPGLDSKDVFNEKVMVLPARLSDADLGLSQEEYSMLETSATTIMHLAWAVNFRLRLHSFVKDQIAGLNHLLRLALFAGRAKAPRFVFCSSIASVSNYAGLTVPELPSSNPEDASPIGYSRSKWVAEQICLQAVTQHATLRKRLAVVRVGQLSGATDTGIWNMNEAWPTMLASAKLTGVLPDLRDQVLHLLPMDVAAKSMIEGCEKLDDESQTNDSCIWHLVNQRNGVSWSKLLECAGQEQSISLIAPSDWIQKLEKMQMEDPGHPSFKLLDHWKGLYGRTEPNDDQSTKGDQTSPERVFETTSAEAAMPTLVELSKRGLDQQYLERSWTWIMSQA